MEEYFQNMTKAVKNHECFTKYIIEMDFLNRKNLVKYPKK